MEYIKRNLETKFIRLNAFFKAILVTGARQVGKTTMLRHLAQGGARTYVTLDDLMARNLAKTDPKLYFCDTGLAAYLARWLTRETLMNGAVAGHYFENHVVVELLKNYAYSPHRAELSYYRDANAKEIDLFVELDNTIHPLEIKKTANPDRREIKKFSVLDQAPLQRGPGGLICLCEEVIPIDGKNCFIPCNLI